MKSISDYIRIALIIAIFTFISIPNAMAWIKAGEATVYEGETVTISLAETYQYTLRKATGITYKWYSESDSYARVTSSTKDYAVIKGIKPTSTCKIYYQCSYYIDNFYRTMDFYYEVTVKSSSISVTSVELSQYSADLKEGETLYLNAYVYPTNATNRNVSWSSSNSSIATVSYDGIVKAVSPGTATITCRANDGSGKYATCTVTVRKNTVYVSGITLSETSSILKVGETLQLKASLTPDNATDKTVTWSSDNSRVATVSSTGLVKAISAGKAIITCKANDDSGKSAQCSIQVPEEILPESITLSAENAVMKIGDTLKLESIIEPNNTSNKIVSWSSDDITVASVDNNGLVTAHSVGSVNVKATTVNNLAASCFITVREKDPVIEYNWEGHYKVSSSHIGSNTSREYPDEFEMYVEKNGDDYYLTKFLGEDLKENNNGGIKLNDNGDGSVSLELLDHDILQYTSINNPLYILYVWDEIKDDWADNWIFKLNEDGSISIGEFYVASFKWNEQDKKWKDGTLEVQYYDVIAQKESFNWEGHFHVTSSQEDDNPTREYPDNFEMVIEKVDDKLLLTSILGEDLKTYNYGGLLVTDNGDGTATVDVSDDIILQITSYDNPLYVMYFWDEEADDWADKWIFKVNEDGSLTLGDFYVASYHWSERDSKWIYGKLEVLYYNLRAEKSTPPSSEQDYRNVLIGDLYYDLYPDSYTASVVCKIDPLTNEREYGYISGDVSIPESVRFHGNDYSVTAIDEEAFAGSDITSLVLPNTLKSIGDSALAFTGISDIELPERLEKIGSYAFEGSELESLVIGQNVNFIGQGIICSCEYMKAIYVDSNNKNYRSFENCLYDTDLKKLYASPSQLINLKFPEELEIIGAYSCTEISMIEKLTFPDHLRIIENDAFLYCENLSEVIFPESLTEIQDFAFMGCYNLKEVAFGSNLKRIGNFSFTSKSISLIKIQVIFPPEIEENTFRNYDATLLVPLGRKPVYQNHDIWKKFENITDDESEVGGILEITDLDEYQKFDIYHINGNIIKRNASKDDFLGLKPGLYIIGNKKVIIQ